MKTLILFTLASIKRIVKIITTVLVMGVLLTFALPFFGFLVIFWIITGKWIDPEPIMEGYVNWLEDW